MWRTTSSAERITKSPLSADSGQRRSRIPMVLLALITAMALAVISVYLGLAGTLAGLYLIVMFVVLRESRAARTQRAALQGLLQERCTGYDSVIDALCGAIGLRENVSGQQAQRVCQLGCILAWQMGLREEQVSLVGKAAVLLEVGKFGIAEEVLRKPGALNEREWSETKRHPELGYQILNGIDSLRDVAEIVYTHHERFDRTGYPRGLSSDDIPVSSRILAVVDAYAAMTSFRPYRRTLSHAGALEEIARHSGTQFDPEVVNAFRAAAERGLLRPDAVSSLDGLARSALPSEASP